MTGVRQELMSYDKVASTLACALGDMTNDHGNLSPIQAKKEHYSLQEHICKQGETIHLVRYK